MPMNRFETIVYYGDGEKNYECDTFGEAFEKAIKEIGPKQPGIIIRLFDPSLPLDCPNSTFLTVAGITWLEEGEKESSVRINVNKDKLKERLRK